MRFDLERYLSRLGAIETGNKFEVRLNCPNCGDEGYHLYFNLSHQCGLCFKCNFSPSLLRLIMEFEGCDDLGARRFLQKSTLRTGKISQMFPETSLVSRSGRAPEKPLLSLPPGFKLLNSLDKFPSYAASRGITHEIAEEFKIGMTLLGRYAWHLIFPVFKNYRLFGFVARRMSNDGSRRYLYPKGFKTSEVLYRIDELTRNNCVLVEGVFDCIPLQFEAAALLGSFLSKIHLKLLLKKGFKKIYLALDSDAKEKTKEAGIKLCPYFDVKVAKLSNGDPGSYQREKLLEKIKDALDFDEWKYNWLREKSLTC